MPTTSSYPAETAVPDLPAWPTVLCLACLVPVDGRRLTEHDCPEPPERLSPKGRTSRKADR